MSEQVLVDTAGTQCRGNLRFILSLILLLLPASMCSAIAGPERASTVADTYREAYDAGFTDGKAAGQGDKESNRLFDVANKKSFQTADRGYVAARHDREVYIVAYRRGFEDGYEKGYGLVSRESPRQDRTTVPISSGAMDRNPPVSVRSSSRVTTGTIPAGTEIQIELLETLSTRFNERGDTFKSQVLQDVQVDQGVVIPRGTEVVGSISYLKRAGRIRGRAMLNLRFEELRFPDGRNLPFEASVLSVESQSPEQVGDDEGTVVAPSGRGEDAQKVGTTAGVGGLVGVISGGGRGAGVGAAAGAVAGLTSVLFTRGRDAQLEARTQLTIRVDRETKLSSVTP